MRARDLFSMYTYRPIFHYVSLLLARDSLMTRRTKRYKAATPHHECPSGMAFDS